MARKHTQPVLQDPRAPRVTWHRLPSPHLSPPIRLDLAPRQRLLPRPSSHPAPPLALHIPLDRRVRRSVILACSHHHRRGGVRGDRRRSLRPLASQCGDAAADADADSPLAKLRAVASQVEDYIEIYSQPLKPHLPAIGRFLIVVTFLEDAWRIVTQWSDQLWYLHRSVLFLLIQLYGVAELLVGR